ncbi:MAG: BamA/TamA family outer membrane protein [bacterium]|nr:BamA/TamA family outer membrane protein [Candidatus Limimorpha equi]
MRRKGFYIIFLLLTAFLLSSCSLRRHVPQGQYLVRQNYIIIDSAKFDVSESELSNYITQKPYRGLISLNLKPWVYYVTKDKTDKKSMRWLNETVGQEPFCYEKNSADYSSQQMERYLDHVGYFNSKVTNSVKTRRFKAFVIYNVKLGRPYTINALKYDIPDTLISRYVHRIAPAYPIKEGDIYDEYKLNEIRDQITEMMRNRGYYYFTRDNITYEVDSNFHNHTLSVTMKIADMKNEADGSMQPHKQYVINSISIYPNYILNYQGVEPTSTDSITVEVGRKKVPNKLKFYYFGKPMIKPQTFSQAIQIQTGMPYSLRRVTQTYSALNNFKAFSNINITFDTVPNAPDTANLLDCRITMQQVDRHSYTFQLEGTRAESDLGIKGGLSYTNRNIFRGAEILQISLRGGLEAQKVISLDTLDRADKLFNTKEIGLTASLIFPKFLSPFPLRNFARDYQPKTNITLGFNGQVRYYYTRYIIQASYGFDWKSNTRLQHFLTPIYLNTVKISNLNKDFKRILDQEYNQRKKDQYTDHLIFGLRYSFVFNTQNLYRKGSFIYLRTDFETSGNLISLFNKTNLIDENEAHHELFGIRYAQYVRGNFDFRQHILIHNETWLVFREQIGLGIPFGNSKDMPFERSFYAGGANGMRGWRYRSLGPGAYIPTQNDLEQIGDLQLEMNAEFRFPIYDIVKGAVFVDAGNVWTYTANEALPDGNFEFDTFYKQLAMDAGIGLRFDIKFIVLRADIAMAMLNPYRDESGSRWRFNGKYRNWNFNIGIGYPF